MEDLSGSYSDDLVTLRTLVGKITAAVQAFDPNAHFGITTFCDKPISPYGALSSNDFMYRLELPLVLGDTKGQSAIQKKLNEIKVFYGADGPESQLDGLLFSVVDPEVGWREGTRHIVLLSTDANFHSAGEGLLGTCLVLT